MKYSQTKEERQTILDNVKAETLKRMSKIVGGKFNATFGDEQIKRKPEYNLNYATGPMLELVDQYNKLVDDSQYEINGLHRMMDTKKLDISQLGKETVKFLKGAGDKTSWNAYECLLANERTTNERLQEQLKKKNDIATLLKEGQESTYQSYFAQNSIFGSLGPPPRM